MANKRKTAKPKCAICSQAMLLKSVIPQAWKCPELRTYQCSGCGNRRTVEHESELVVPELVQSAA